jgi:ABC-type polysaccharide/polyol phosphate export permease
MDYFSLAQGFGKTKTTLSRNFYILYTLAHLKQKANVRGTVLGYLWWFIEPLLLIILYSYVVGVIFGYSGPDRILMIAIGVTLWKWWSTSLTSAVISFRRYKGIVTQVKMPLSILPVSEVFGQTYLFLFGYFLLQCGLLVMGHSPNLLSLLLTFLTSVMMVSTLALVLAILNVLIRDTAFLVGFSLRILFYITPILYSRDRVPDRYQWVVDLNPFAYLVEFYNRALIYPHQVNLMENLFSLLMAAVSLAVFFVICQRLAPYIVRNV